jgi:histidinol-phosphate aminotransferase
VLVRFDDAESAGSAYEFMLSRGVITRAMGGYGLPDSLRITVGLESEVKAVVDAVAAHRKSS